MYVLPYSFHLYFVFCFIEPLRFKFCSCISVVGCTCDRKNSIEDQHENVDIFHHSSETIARQLTLIDAVSFSPAGKIAEKAVWRSALLLLRYGDFAGWDASKIESSQYWGFAILGVYCYSLLLRFGTIRVFSIFLHLVL